jgi:hypothetical protein
MTPSIDGSKTGVVKGFRGRRLALLDKVRSLEFAFPAPNVRGSVAARADGMHSTSQATPLIFHLHS